MVETFAGISFPRLPHVPSRAPVLDQVDVQARKSWCPAANAGAIAKISWSLPSAIVQGPVVTSGQPTSGAATESVPRNVRVQNDPLTPHWFHSA